MNRLKSVPIYLLVAASLLVHSCVLVTAGHHEPSMATETETGTDAETETETKTATDATFTLQDLFIPASEIPFKIDGTYKAGVLAIEASSAKAMTKETWAVVDKLASALAAHVEDPEANPAPESDDMEMTVMLGTCTITTDEVTTGYASTCTYKSADDKESVQSKSLSMVVPGQGEDHYRVFGGWAQVEGADDEMSAGTSGIFIDKVVMDSTDTDATKVKMFVGLTTISDKVTGITVTLAQSDA